MGRTIVIVSCTKSKKDRTCKAKEMYSESRLFKASVSYGKGILHADEIYILSAKYGLLFMDDYIDTYDKTLYDMSTEAKKQWAGQTLSELSACLRESDEVISLAGEVYMRYLRDDLEDMVDSYERLFEGVRMNNQYTQMDNAVTEGYR